MAERAEGDALAYFNVMGDVIVTWHLLDMIIAGTGGRIDERSECG